MRGVYLRHQYTAGISCDPYLFDKGFAFFITCIFTFKWIESVFPAVLPQGIFNQNRERSMYFQDLITSLNDFWSKKGCALLQPYDTEVGAGTFHPATFFRVMGHEPWKTAYVEPCRRPTDGRYGENPNRLQQYYQYQVIMKPSPLDSQGVYLES